MGKVYELIVKRVYSKINGEWYVSQSYRPKYPNGKKIRNGDVLKL